MKPLIERLRRRLAASTNPTNRLKLKRRIELLEKQRSAARPQLARG